MTTISGTYPLLSIFREHFISEDSLLEIVRRQETPALAMPPENLSYVIKYPHNDLIEAISPKGLEVSTLTVSENPIFFSVDILTLEDIIKLNTATISETEYLVFRSRYPLELLSSEAYIEKNYPNLKANNPSNFQFFKKPESPNFSRIAYQAKLESSKKEAVKITPDLLYISKETKEILEKEIEKREPEENSINDIFSQIDWMSSNLKKINRISEKHKKILRTKNKTELNELKQTLKSELATALSRSPNSQTVDYCIKLILPKDVLDSRNKYPDLAKGELLKSIDHPSEILQFANWLSKTKYEARKLPSSEGPVETSHQHLEDELRKTYKASPNWANTLAFLIAQ